MKIYIAFNVIGFILIIAFLVAFILTGILAFLIVFSLVYFIIGAVAILKFTTSLFNIANDIID